MSHSFDGGYKSTCRSNLVTQMIDETYKNKEYG